MSTPANKADTQQKTELSFAERVNKIVTEAEVDDKGNLKLPDDLSEELQFAANTEKRRRDTQSAYTKQIQTNKALEVEKSTLLNKFGEVDVKLTPEQAEELENLKFEDPEAWRKKLNQYEKDARKQRVAEIDEELKKVSKSTLEGQELESRKEKLAAFQEAHPDFELNDDVIASDIPPRITKKLETGAITFEEFLNECHSYLTTGKVVKQGDAVMGQPNIGRVGGSHQPEKNALNKDEITSYNKEVF